MNTVNTATEAKMPPTKKFAACWKIPSRRPATMAPRLMSEEGPMGFTRLAASKPTIAAISGFCLAGGLEIAHGGKRLAYTADTGPVSSGCC